jgi:hypothetical protein
MLWKSSRSGLPAAFLPAAHGVEDGLENEPEDEEIGEHLDGDDEAQRLGDRADVPETHGGEHGDGEVERVGPAQRFGERRRVRL